MALDLCAVWAILQGPDADCSWFSVISFTWDLAAKKIFKWPNKEKKKSAFESVKISNAKLLQN